VVELIGLVRSWSTAVVTNIYSGASSNFFFQLCEAGATSDEHISQIAARVAVVHHVAAT
jgi:hypothetical protein